MRNVGFYSPPFNSFMEIHIMSEQQPIYAASSRTPTTLEGFKNLPCTKPFGEWIPPEPEQVKALIELSGLNRRQWAALLGITYSEKHGSTTIRKWCMLKTAKDYREIPYSTWRLMLIYAGVVCHESDIIAASSFGQRAAENS